MTLIAVPHPERPRPRPHPAGTIVASATRTVVRQPDATSALLRDQGSISRDDGVHRRHWSRRRRWDRRASRQADPVGREDDARGVTLHDCDDCCRHPHAVHTGSLAHDRPSRQCWGSTAPRTRDFFRCAILPRRASLVLVTESAAGSAHEDRDMNSYATEQLARQRYDQFAREAHDHRLACLAQSASPLRRPSVGQSPMRRVGGLMRRLPGAMLAGISRQMRQRWGAKASPVGSRAASTRRA